MDKISSALSCHAAYLNSLQNLDAFLAELFDVFLQCLETKQTLHSTAEQNSKRFTENVTVETLEAMLVVLADISRLVIKPKALHQCLLDSGVEAQRSEQFAVKWRQTAGDIVDKLKQNSIENVETLENVDWKVSIKTESCDSKHEKTPYVELNLGMKRNDISLNMTASQLTNLYDTLESIQSKLDELHQRST